MGWAITWCAVREDKAEQFLSQLGLSPTGETEEHPQSLISTAKLDTGWRIVWYDEYDCPFLRPQQLGALSSDKDVLLCLVEEHSMASSAEMWSQGERKWWLSHEGDNGPRGLATDGTVPEPFPAIRKAMASAATAANEREADNPLATDARSTAEIIAAYLNSQRNDDATGSLATVHYRGGPEEFRAGLELLASPDPRERAAGADVLAQLGWQDRTFLEESVDALLNALRDPDGGSRAVRDLCPGTQSKPARD